LTKVLTLTSVTHSPSGPGGNLVKRENPIRNRSIANCLDRGAVVTRGGADRCRRRPQHYSSTPTKISRAGRSRDKTGVHGGDVARSR
jgi:hypothetical protein